MDIFNEKFTQVELNKFASYIADYLAEENAAEVDSSLICDAIYAYIGGAADHT